MTGETPIDFRSDTVTQPTPAMREVMARAQVGDDVFGDDPTVNRLQDQVAELLGKPAALFVPSGTMANQIAIRVQTRPGDEIIVHRLSHVYQYEGGAPALLSGCSFALLEGARGMFSADDVCSAVRPDDPHFPRTSLVVMENTQNRGGGAVWPVEQVAAIGATARDLGLRVHLDGARLMNACIARGVSPHAYTASVDTVSLCFSKGLGAPVGSVIAGTDEFVNQARRMRKVFGGAMRQAGVLAAAAEYALDHHVERLAEDHAHARTLAEGLAACRGITVQPPETNIVYFDLDETGPDAADFAARLATRGVRMIDVGPRRIRAVTHLHIDAADVSRACAVVAEVAAAGA
jgi:threonine aldolase